jgi:hypothetical protein
LPVDLLVIRLACLLRDLVAREICSRSFCHLIPSVDSLK